MFAWHGIIYSVGKGHDLGIVEMVRGARDGSAQDAADHLDDAQVVPFPTEYTLPCQANITSG